MRKQLFIAACLLMVASQWAAAETVAYWRFEAGPADTDVLRPEGIEGYTYSPDIIDVSGNGNHLSVWSEGGAAGYAYRSDVAFPVIPQTGAANNFSVKNTGGGPAMFTMSSQANPTGKDIENITFEQFTIEAFFKPETGGWRTIVGRDARYVANSNGDLAALYFQITDNPSNGFAIKFADVQGYWHEAQAPADTIEGFPFGSDPEGLTGKWYYAAAVSDGQTLSLYLANMTDGQPLQLIAQTDLTASGSTNTALAKGTENGGNWHAGGWSVGRGLYAGGHTDRAFGFIDEVRISDAALSQEELLIADFGSQPAGIQIEPVPVIVDEEGPTSADVFIRLLDQPQAEVWIELDEPAHVKQVVLDRSELIFTPADWDVPQAIRVTAIDDDLLENAEHRTWLTVNVSSADAAFDGLAEDPIEVVVVDNECGAWGYASADLNQDCRVDLADAALLAQWWLACSVPQDPSCIRFDPESMQTF